MGAGGEVMSLARPGVVVLTQPVPQILGDGAYPVRGNFLQCTEASVLESLRKVEYSSRYAIAYYFHDPAFVWPFSWTCRYFEKGDVRYACHDTAKRGATGEQ